MSVLNLPTETIQKIFHLLHFNDLKICAEVCISWATLSCEVSEMKWKNRCKCDFPEVYEDAYRKANLSWEDLYQSLRLWAQVKTSKVYTKYSKLLEERYVPVEEKSLKRLQLLSNGTMGYPFYVVDEWEFEHFTGESYKFNCICYYNATTLEMIDNVAYNYSFDVYEETDDMIVMRLNDFVNDDIDNETTQIYIYSKPDKSVQCNKELYSTDSKIFVEKKRVFYVTEDNTFWMTKVVKVQDFTAFESFAIAPPEVCDSMGRIQAVSCIGDNDNQVKVLTEAGDIFLIADKIGTKLCHIQTRDRNMVIDALRQHNFFWNDPKVYDWMCTKNLAVTHLKDATVYSYFNQVVIIGTFQRVLHIYYNPYRKGQLRLFKAAPTLRIDLNGWVPSGGAWPRYVCESQKKINQIEVVEIKGGHRIILLYCQRLVAIELRSVSSKRPNRDLVDAIGMGDGEYTRIS